MEVVQVPLTKGLMGNSPNWYEGLCTKQTKSTLKNELGTENTGEFTE